jgi:hypothetical protein
VIELQKGSAAPLPGDIHPGHEQLFALFGRDPVQTADDIVFTAGKGIPVKIHLDLFLIRF